MHLQYLIIMINYIDSLINNYYIKSEIETKLSSKLNALVIDGYYTKAEVNTLIAGISTGGDISNLLTLYYLKTETDTKLNLKANILDV